MTPQAKRHWAWSQKLPFSDLITLLALVDITDREGKGTFDPEGLRQMTGHGDRSLAGSIHSLADKGLLKGPRWTAGKGWTTPDIRLALSEERHLRVAA